MVTSLAEGEPISPVPDVDGDPRSMVAMFLGGVSRCVWYDSRGILAE